MSLLLRDAVRIAVTPDYVAALRMSRGLRPRITDKHCIPCDSASGKPLWGPAVSALGELLAKLGPKPADATIVLSNRLLRYALVPWNENLTSRVEEAAFARHCFTSVYGQAAQTWEIRVSRARVGEPQVASAVDSELVRALDGLLAASRLRFRSLQPHLMAAYNRWRGRLGQRTCLFLLVEKRLYTCMALVQGRCRAVRSGPVNGRLTEDLPFMLDREHLWSGMEERPAVFMYAPEHPHIKLPTELGWTGMSLHLQPTEGFSPVSDATYAIAMAPA